MSRGRPRGDDQGRGVEAKIRAAQKSGTIRGRTPEELAQAALAANVIEAKSKALLKARESCATR